MGFVTKSKGRHQFGSVKIGNAADVSFLRDVMAGQVMIPATGSIAIAIGNIASGSGAVQGMTTSHRVFVKARQWKDNESVFIAACLGIANGIQITASNPSATNLSATAQLYDYFAFRTDPS